MDLTKTIVHSTKYFPDQYTLGFHGFGNGVGNGFEYGREPGFGSGWGNKNGNGNGDISSSLYVSSPGDGYRFGFITF